jgi:hypothetical protein
MQTFDLDSMCKSRFVCSQSIIVTQKYVNPHLCSLIESVAVIWIGIVKYHTLQGTMGTKQDKNLNSIQDVRPSSHPCEHETQLLTAT